jgi:MFS family permease
MQNNTVIKAYMNRNADTVIIAGFFTIFISYAVRYSHGLLLPFMLPSLGISNAQAGAIYSSYFIAYTFFSPILGLMTDRSAVRNMLTFFIALLGLGAFLMSYTNGIISACFFFGLAGIGQSAGWVPVVTIVQRWVKPNKRGAALATVDIGSGAGIIIAGLVLPLIVTNMDWRWGWRSLGILGFIVSGINYLFIKNPPADLVTNELNLKSSSPASVPQVIKELIKIPAFWFIGFSYMMIGSSILIPFTFLTSYATISFQISYDSAALLITILATCGIVGKLFFGYLSDTVGRIRVMLLCAILTTIGPLGMAFSETYSSLTISTIVFGVGYGALWPVYTAASRDFFPKEHSGSVIGFWTLLMGTGSIISPVVAGWAIDLTGHYTFSFEIAAFASIISGLLLLPVLHIPSQN